MSLNYFPSNIVLKILITFCHLFLFFFFNKNLRSVRVKMLIMLFFKIVNGFYFLLCACVYFLNIIQRTSITLVIRKNY